MHIGPKSNTAGKSGALLMKTAAFGHEVVKTPRSQDKRTSLNTESIHSVSCLGCASLK